MIVRNANVTAANASKKIGPNTIQLQDQSGMTEYSKEVLVSIVQDVVDGFKGLDVAKYRVSDMLKFFSGGRKAIDIGISPENISVGLTLDFHYGQAIHELSARIREKIKNTIESITGLVVSRVDVRVSHVTKENSRQPILNNKKNQKLLPAMSRQQAGLDVHSPYGDTDQVEQR